MDDLVKRLRDFDPHLHEWEVVDEAADRIDALERERDELWKLFVHWREEADDRAEQRDAARRDAVEAEAYATELKAKLAEAIEALQAIAAEASVPLRTGKNGINFKKMCKGWRKIATERIDIARAALAEIGS